MGLKSFNRTGQENTTTEVLRPTVRPETRRRNALLIAIVLVAVCIMAAMAQQRSQLPFIPSSEDSHGLADHAQTGNTDTSN